MGADLYIKSLYDVQRAKYEGRFRYWVEVRDRATDPADKARAQRRVSAYFTKIFARGYFRDSYNNTNLLWLFELSWWDDVGRLLDAQGRLAPRSARTLRRWLTTREAIFTAHLATLPPAAQRYFRKKYQTLRAFLREAIKRNEPIACSV